MLRLAIIAARGNDARAVVSPWSARLRLGSGGALFQTRNKPRGPRRRRQGLATTPLQVALVSRGWCRWLRRRRALSCVR